MINLQLEINIMLDAKEGLDPYILLWLLLVLLVDQVTTDLVIFDLKIF